MQPKPKSILCCDVGKRRVGLAGCDPLGITVTSLPALHRTSFGQDIETLKKHCSERQVLGLVVGLPLDESGKQTKQASYCQRYGLRIAMELRLQLAFVNEHSSSWAAAERFQLSNDRSGLLDSAVAVILLEQWLKEGPELKPVEMASNEVSKFEADA